MKNLKLKTREKIAIIFLIPITAAAVVLSACTDDSPQRAKAPTLVAVD